MILAIKTDQPQAYLALVETDKEITDVFWHAHRELSDTIFIKLDELLKKAETDYTRLTGLVVFQGPGSFTGLRIGITIANTLAYSQDVPIVGAQGENWLKDGVELLNQGIDQKIVTPFYGGEANITKPRK